MMETSQVRPEEIVAGAWVETVAEKLTDDSVAWNARVWVDGESVLFHCTSERDAEKFAAHLIALIQAHTAD